LNEKINGVNGEVRIWKGTAVHYFGVLSLEIHKKISETSVMIVPGFESQ
jgi:hypothetical protein